MSHAPDGRLKRTIYFADLTHTAQGIGAPTFPEGELGINELLVHKALLYMETDDITALLFAAVTRLLQQRNLLTPAREDYLNQLRRFIVNRKKSIDQTDWVLTDRYTYDFNAISAQHYDDQQKKHIMKQLTLYKSTAIGLGRLAGADVAEVR